MLLITATATLFDAALERHHPAGIRHHHLAILAARPDRQGRGEVVMYPMMRQPGDQQEGPE